MLAQLEKDYPQEVRFVYRHFPLISIHDKAALAVQAAQAAGDQEKFWEMHDLLFEKQSTWSGLSVADFQKWLVDQASGLGLDKQKFESDLTSQKNVDIAQQAWNDGQAAGIGGTPSLVFNDVALPNNFLSYTNIVALIKLKELEKTQFSECPPLTVDKTKQYFATLHTDKGDIVIQLYADKAPLAVNNFIFLSKQGWYNNVTFHRVISGFVAQAGDPTGTGFGGPGYAFENEISPDLKFDKAGVVGMANAGPGSNGSQFFITFGPASQLDGGYTIFGQVIQGMDVAQKLTPRDPSKSSDLPPGDKILSIDILEK